MTVHERIPSIFRPLLGMASMAALVLSHSSLYAQSAKASDSEAPASDCPPGAYCEQAEIAPSEKAAPRPVRRGARTKSGAQATRKSQAEPTPNAPKQASTSSNPAGDLIVVPAKKKGRIYVIKKSPSGRPVVTEYAPVTRTPRPRRNPAKIHKKFSCCKDPSAPRSRRVGVSLRGLGSVVPTPYRKPITMMGGGASLRFRPLPAFAVDLGFDRVTGENEAQTYRRREDTFSLNALLYAFPKSFFQPYLIGGIHGSMAHIESDDERLVLPRGNTASYAYVGMQGGIGASLRFSRGFGLSFDGIGFLRKRVDGDARDFPEFIDQDRGIASNVGGGFLFRTGINFWF